MRRALARRFSFDDMLNHESHEFCAFRGSCFNEAVFNLKRHERLLTTKTTKDTKKYNKQIGIIRGSVQKCVDAIPFGKHEQIDHSYLSLFVVFV